MDLSAILAQARALIGDRPIVSVAEAMPLTVTDEPYLGVGRPTKEARARRAKATRLIVAADDLCPPDEVVTWAPTYYGGAFKFKPRSDVELALRVEWSRKLERRRCGQKPRQIEVVCRTCQEQLAGPVRDYRDETGQPRCEVLSLERLFGCANDHLRTTQNHDVVVRDAFLGDVIFWAQTDPLASTI